MDNNSLYLVLQALQWLLIAIASLLFINTTIHRLLHHHQPHRTPPGPQPWPIIGNLNLLINSPLPHHSLHLLSQQYGDLMLLKFGSKPILVASSPHTAELFLKTHDAVFASRPATAAGEHTFHRADLTWLPYGPEWRHGRKIMLSEVIAPRKQESFSQVRFEEMMGLISGLYEVGSKSEKTVFLRDHLLRFTLCMMTKLVLGHKYFNNNDKNGTKENSMTFEKLQGILDEWFLLNGVINVGDWIPWLNGFDLQGYVKRMRELSKEYVEFLSIVIDDHMDMMKSDKNFVPKDMLDIFLQFADGPNCDVELQLTRDRLMGLIHNMLAGGTDTAAATVEWAFQELIRKPKIIERAKEEIERVIGRERWVEEKDLSNLPYIEAIMKETFRLHPLCALLPPHYSMEDCTVTGYDVEKGTTVLVNAWSIGRNPKYWDRADEFRPERFLEKNVDIKGYDFELLPFGSGRRRCPGYSLGVKVVQTTLANLIHGFDWELGGGVGAEDVSMEEVYGLTTHPKFPLSYLIHPRLSTHLYSQPSKRMN